MNPLYRTNSYQQEADTVLATTSLHEGRTAVICRDLLLFPGGGGQCADRGSLNLRGADYPVTAFVKHQGDVLLVLETRLPFHDELKRNEPVRQILDWEHRYRAMRLHTWQHALGAAARELTSGFGARPMEISAEAERCSMRFVTDEPVTERSVDEMVALVASAVAAAVPVTVHSFPNLEAARASMGDVLRVNAGLPEFRGKIRLVAIGAGEPDAPLRDASPCGGTHLRSLAEVTPGPIEDLRHHEEAGEWELIFALP